MTEIVGNETAGGHGGGKRGNLGDNSFQRFCEDYATNQARRVLGE
jgi:hypothetical protein